MKILSRIIAVPFLVAGFIVHWWMPQKLGFGPGWVRRKKQKIRLVKIRGLKIEPSYQQEIDFGLVEKLVRDWDPTLIPPITVARTRLGRHVLIDGQYRVEAARLRGERSIPARVEGRLSRKERAALFLRMNRRP